MCIRDRDQIVETLIEEANRIAGEMDLGEDGGDQAAAGAPVVSVH